MHSNSCYGRRADEGSPRGPYFVIAYPTLAVPEGYWGRFDYLPTVGLALVSGGFRGGFWGLLVGAGSVPIISLYMGF